MALFKKSKIVVQPYCPCLFKTEDGTEVDVYRYLLVNEISSLEVHCAEDLSVILIVSPAKNPPRFFPARIEPGIYDVSVCWATQLPHFNPLNKNTY
jgi:hypothetical protein